jgi:hypothetical protein
MQQREVRPPWTSALKCCMRTVQPWWLPPTTTEASTVTGTEGGSVAAGEAAMVTLLERLMTVEGFQFRTTVGRRCALDTKPSANIRRPQDRLSRSGYRWTTSPQSTCSRTRTFGEHQEGTKCARSAVRRSGDYRSGTCLAMEHRYGSIRRD